MKNEMPDINLIPTEYKKKGFDLGANFAKIGGIVLAFLTLSLLVYGGLFIYKRSLTRQIEDIDNKMTELESKRNNELENAIYNADKKLTTVENLFKDHFYWSKVFAKIEELAIADVYFTEAKVALDAGAINLALKGNAASYTSLARQMVSFKEEKLVEKVDLGDVKLSESGGIDFSLSVLISKAILLSQTENKD